MNKNLFIVFLSVSIFFLSFKINTANANITTHSQFHNITNLSDTSLSKLTKIAATHLGFPPSDKKYSSFSRNQSLAIFAISHYFEKDDFEDAIKIAWCESRLSPTSVNKRNPNGTFDYGLFQLNDGGTMQRLGVNKESAIDPFVNAKAAKVLFDDRGWKPWACKGKLKKE